MSKYLYVVFSSHLLEKRAPACLRKRIFLPPPKPPDPTLVFIQYFWFYTFQPPPPRPVCEGPVLPYSAVCRGYGAAPLRLTTKFSRVIYGLACAGLSPHSSSPWALWFLPHHSTEIIPQRSPPHQNHCYPLSLCGPCPPQRLHYVLPSSGSPSALDALR